MNPVNAYFISHVDEKHPSIENVINDKFKLPKEVINQQEYSNIWDTHELESWGHPFQNHDAINKAHD